MFLPLTLNFKIKHECSGYGEKRVLCFLGSRSGADAVQGWGRPRGGASLQPVPHTVPLLGVSHGHHSSFSPELRKFGTFMWSAAG